MQAKQNQCILSFLSSLHMTKLLQMHQQNENGEAALAHHFPQVKDVKQLAGDLTKLFETSELVPAEMRERIRRYAGLAPASKEQKEEKESNHKRDLQEALSAIKSGDLAVRAGTSEAQSTESATKSAQVHAVYLPASD